LSRHWAEYGFGAPKVTALIYIAKLLFFYVLGGALVATLTSGARPAPPGRRGWDDVVVYQKGRAVDGCCSSASASPGLVGAPLAGHFKPMTGGACATGRAPRTIRPPRRGPRTCRSPTVTRRTKGRTSRLYLALPREHRGGRSCLTGRDHGLDRAG